MRASVYIFVLNGLSGKCKSIEVIMKTQSIYRRTTQIVRTPAAVAANVAVYAAETKYPKPTYKNAESQLQLSRWKEVWLE